MSTDAVNEQLLYVGHDASKGKNPWWIVLAMVLGLTFGTGAVAHYVMGPLIKVITAEFGWSRGAMSGAVSLFFAGAALSFVAFGALVDRWGPRRVVLLSMSMLAASLLLLQFGDKLWHFYLILLIMGLCGGGATAVPYVKAIAASIDHRRGLALGLGAAGAGLGGIILPFYMVEMLDAYGWRTAVTGLAVLILLVPLPGAWFALAGMRPLRRERTVAEKDDSSYLLLFRSVPFWQVAISITLVSFAVNGIIVHAVPLLTDRGMSAAGAAGAMGVIGVTSALARVISGYLMDLFFAPYVAALSFFLAAAGSTLLMLGGTGPAVYAALILIAFTLGSEVDAMNYLLSRYLPMAVIGKAIGLTFAVFTLAGSAAVAALGASYDVFGSYEYGLAVSSVLAILASLLVRSLGPYPNKIGH